MLAATLDGPLSRAFGQSGYTNGATPSGSQSSSQNHPLAGLLGGGTSGGSKLIPIKNGKGESDGGSSNDHVDQVDLTPLSLALLSSVIPQPSPLYDRPLPGTMLRCSLARCERCSRQPRPTTKLVLHSSHSTIPSRSLSKSLDRGRSCMRSSAWKENERPSRWRGCSNRT